MKWDDIYRSDLKFDKMKVAHRISTWYDDLIDLMRDPRKQRIDQYLAAVGIEDVMSSEDLYNDLLRLQAQDLSHLHRKIRGVLQS